MLALASQRKSTSLVNRTYFGSLFPPLALALAYIYIALTIDTSGMLSIMGRA